MAKQENYSMSLFKEDHVENLKSTIRNAFTVSGDRNVNLHTTTSESCYSSEINLTHEEGTLEEQIDGHIKFWTNPEEPTYNINICSSEFDGGPGLVDVTFRTVNEFSEHELELREMYRKMVESKE